MSRALVMPSEVTIMYVYSQAVTTITLWPSRFIETVRFDPDFWDVHIRNRIKWPFLNWWNTLGYFRHQAVHLLFFTKEKSKHNQNHVCSFCPPPPVALALAESNTFPLPFPPEFRDKFFVLYSSCPALDFSSESNFMNYIKAFSPNCQSPQGQCSF